MKTFKQLAFAGLLMSAASWTHAAFVGSITESGTYYGEVSTADGWGLGNTADDGVDFWQLSVGAGHEATLSLDIFSDIDFGVSIYRGLVSGDAGFFDNSGSFTNLFGDHGEFIAGTPAYGYSGGSLSDVFLASAGDYTIAVGGADFGFDGPYSYGMDLDLDVTPVPLPGSMGFALLGSSLLMWVRRRQRKNA